MASNVRTADWPDNLRSDEDAIFRIQGILLQNAEGERDDELNREYVDIRRVLLAHQGFRDHVPRMIRVHRDLSSLWPYMKSFDPQWDPRRKHVRDEMKPLFEQAEAIARTERIDAISGDPPFPASSSISVDPSTWTGAKSARQKLAAAKSLLPLAQASIEQMIDQLSVSNHNNAPPLDEAEEALENLRLVHSVLGEIIEAAEAGSLEGIESQGLPAEAAKYAKRAARALKDDPLPYATSGLVLGILTACGFPGIGGYLSMVAMTIRNNKK